MEFKPTNWFAVTVNMHLHVHVHVTIKIFPNAGLLQHVEIQSTNFSLLSILISTQMSRIDIHVHVHTCTHMYVDTCTLCMYMYQYN